MKGRQIMDELFLYEITPTGVIVELRDERLTTVEAERTMISDGVRRRRRKTAVDPIAAALILQGYLDSRRGAPG